MKIDTNSLPNDPDQLKKMLLELQETMAKKDKELIKKDKELVQKDKDLAKKEEIINGLLERYEIARRKQFGKSSEQNPGAGETFNEVEEILDKEDKALLAEADNEQITSVKKYLNVTPFQKSYHVKSL